MAGLNELVREYKDDFQDGIAMILVWKEGRSWKMFSTYCLDCDLTWVCDEDKEEIENIIKTHKDAVLLNGYQNACDTTVKEIADRVKYIYDEAACRACDKLTIQETEETESNKSMKKFTEGMNVSFSTLYGGTVTAIVSKVTDTQITLTESWVAEDTMETVSEDIVYDKKVDDSGNEYITIWEYYDCTGTVYGEETEKSRNEETVKINSELEIVKLDGSLKFKNSIGYVKPCGYCFRHPEKGYLAFNDDVYIPCGGKNVLEDILSDGGFLYFDNVSWLNPITDDNQLEQVSEIVQVYNQQYVNEAHVQYGNKTDKELISLLSMSSILVSSDFELIWKELESRGFKYSTRGWKKSKTLEDKYVTHIYHLLKLESARYEVYQYNYDEYTKNIMNILERACMRGVNFKHLNNLIVEFLGTDYTDYYTPVSEVRI